MPLFVWPTDGDRATIWGSWIWDCGHWQSGENNTAGVTTGEHSELHPLSAIAVDRRAPYLSARGESETDVFVSNEGDAAHAVEQCALAHHPLTSAAYPQYDAGFKPCATAPANRLQPLAKSYSFFVPAPPRPGPASRLQYRVVNRITGGSGTQRVQQKANGLEVTVTLDGSGDEVRYGKSFFVSWTGRARHAPDPLDVTLKSILIMQSQQQRPNLLPGGAVVRTGQPEPSTDLGEVDPDPASPATTALAGVGLFDDHRVRPAPPGRGAGGVFWGFWG